MKWYKVRARGGPKGIAITIWVKAFGVFEAANILSNLLPPSTVQLNIEVVIDITKSGVGQ